jgi:hypothetical protein
MSWRKNDSLKLLFMSYTTDATTSTTSTSRSPSLSSSSNEESELEPESSIGALEALMGSKVFNRFYYQLAGLLFGDMCSRGYASDLPHQVDIVMEWYQQDDNASRLTAHFADPVNQDYRSHYNAFKEMFIDNNDTIWAAYLGMQSNQTFLIMMASLSGRSDAIIQHLDRGLYGRWKAAFDSQERASFLKLPRTCQESRMWALKREQDKDCVIC